MKRSFTPILVLLFALVVATPSLALDDGWLKGASSHVLPVTSWVDSFDGPTLANGWMWLRQDLAHWSLSAHPGCLRILTQPQALYSDAPNNQANILLRPAPPGDFAISTRVAFAPTGDYHQAALLVYRNDDNFILIDRGHCSTCLTGGQGVYFDSEKEGMPAFLAKHVYTPTVVDLRIERNGTTYTASYRSPESNWTVLGQVDRPDLSNALVGISATNSNPEPSVPSVTADYDFFQIDSQVWSDYLPIVRRPDSGPMPVILDDDGSPDGMIALLYLLQHPAVSVKAITVSNGEAHTDIFARNILRMLARMGRKGIPVAAGRTSPLVGDNAFPDPWREGSDRFWEISLPAPIEAVQPISASQLIVQVVKQSPQPVTIFVSGPQTNLVEALRLDPSIANNIRLVQIMGGAVYAPGNIHSDWPPFENRVAEFNIWVDPVAASEVFSAGLPLRVVPLDPTNQVLWMATDAAGWEAACTAESILAAELLRWMLVSWVPSGVYVWDAVTAVDTTDSGLCWTDRLHLDVITAPGDQQGRTVPSTSQPANATVCLIPSADLIKARMASILGRH